MAGPAIRPAGAADAPALAMLRRVWTEEGAGGALPDDDDHESRVRAWLAEQGELRLVWLAEVDGRPVGVVTAIVIGRLPRPGRDQTDATWGYLQHCFVLPEHRSQGIGRALVDLVVADADERGWTHLLLHTTPGARSLYQRAGFVPADEWMVRRR